MTIINTTAIKNLSIALEALSRINSAEEPFIRVSRMLDEELTRAEVRVKEQQTQHRIPADEEIPF